MNVESPVQTEPELDAKWRRRRFVFCRSRSAQEDLPIAGLCTHLQASNLFLARLRQPRDEETCSVRLDQLLRHPEAFSRSFGLNPDEVSLVEAGVLQPRQVRRLRRAHDHDVAAAGNDLAHRWSEQAPLRNRRLRLEDFGESVAGPAAAWKLGIERGEATRDHRRDRRAQLVATPDGGLDVGWQVAGARSDPTTADAVLRRRKR